MRTLRKDAETTTHFSHNGYRIQRTQSRFMPQWLNAGSHFFMILKPEGKMIHTAAFPTPQLLTHPPPEASSIRSQQQMDAKAVETAQVSESVWGPWGFGFLRSWLTPWEQINSHSRHSDTAEGLSWFLLHCHHDKGCLNTWGGSQHKLRKSVY